MMKILFLNPQVDAEHKIVQALQAKGHGVLLPMNPKEAEQMLQLHGDTVGLAIIQREGTTGSEEGIQFLDQLKSDPAQADLPVIVSSSEWGEAEFATHQNTPNGAHAYIKWPCETEALLELMASMFGEAPAAAPPPPADSPGLVLEDATGIFGIENKEISKEFSLEAPELGGEAGPTLTMPAAPAEATTVAVAESADPDALTQDPALEALLERPVDPATINAPPAPQSELSSVDIGALEEFDASNAEQAAEATDLGAPEELAPEAVSEDEPVNDEELAAEMPYLFSSKKKGQEEGAPNGVPAALVFAQPVGDAVVPGGAAQSPDVETLKKYLMLREQDVAVLSTQLKTAQEQVATLENLIKTERTSSTELQRTVDDQKRKIEEFEKEKTLAMESLHSEISELRFQLKSKSDKGRMLEVQVREAAEEIERVKERVRSDIRKIRVREKELENRLEIMKKDSEALIAARENKIVELKRKIDLLEFNMDLLQDQYSREKESNARLRERLARAAQVVRAAGGILDTPGGTGSAEETGEQTGSKAS